MCNPQKNQTRQLLTFVVFLYHISEDLQHVAKIREVINYSVTIQMYNSNKNQSKINSRSRIFPIDILILAMNRSQQNCRKLKMKIFPIVILC